MAGLLAAETEFVANFLLWFLLIYFPVPRKGGGVSGEYEA